LLNVDSRVRRLCLIDEGEKGYPRSVLTRFTKRVGVDRLRRIIEEKVVTLLRRNRATEVDAILDASFIRAWSIRHPADNRKGLSDREARVGRTDRTYCLGYKLHLSVDFERKLPLASHIAPANQNEKKHCLTILEWTKGALQKAGAKLRSIVADSQYSSQKVKGAVDEAVIPIQKIRSATLRAS
jgi:hypothetical protein